MEVQYDQEPFARPRYGYIVTDAGHEEQRVEQKSAMPPHRGKERLSAAPRVWLAQFLPYVEKT